MWYRKVCERLSGRSPEDGAKVELSLGVLSTPRLHEGQACLRPTADTFMAIKKYNEEIYFVLACGIIAACVGGCRAHDQKYEPAFFFVVCRKAYTTYTKIPKN